MKGVWIGLEVGEHCHVTIVLRQDATEDDIKRLDEQILNMRVKRLLPLILVIKPGIHMFGYNKDTPVMKVSFADIDVDSELHSIYAEWYQQKEGYTPHPELDAHITVDKPERLQEVEELLAKTKGVYMVTRATLKPIGEKTVIAQVSKGK